VVLIPEAQVEAIGALEVLLETRPVTKWIAVVTSAPGKVGAPELCAHRKVSGTVSAMAPSATARPRIEP